MSILCRIKNEEKSTRKCKQVNEKFSYLWISSSRRWLKTLFCLSTYFLLYLKCSHIFPSWANEEKTNEKKIFLLVFTIINIKMKSFQFSQGRTFSIEIFILLFFFVCSRRLKFENLVRIFCIWSVYQRDWAD